MYTLEELKPIVYALTLADRKNKKALWQNKGFKKIKNRKDFLLNYWDCRLKQGKPEDLNLYSAMLAGYNRAIGKVQEAQNNIEGSGATEGKTLERKKILATPGQMLTSATSAAARWVKSGLVTVDDDTIKKRLDICKSCEFWDNTALRGTGRCRKCGCSTWAKIRMATEQCPEKKWLAVNE
jgi:hypothetical protein